MGRLVSVIRYLGSGIRDDKETCEKRALLSSVSVGGLKHLPSSPRLVCKTSDDEYNVVEKEVIRRIRHYSNGDRILLVGEGDFSFSTCLARSFGWAGNMVATSLNSEDFLVKNYKYALPNIVELCIRKCKVMHEIDATSMANHEVLGAIKFDRIIFNFPFAGFFGNMPLDSQLRCHRRLVSLFLKNAKAMLNENGQIHISHKTNGVHAEWKLESMASSHGLMLIEAVDFKLHHYPGYNTKRGFGGDDNFNCYPSKTYKFGLKC